MPTSAHTASSSRSPRQARRRSSWPTGWRHLPSCWSSSGINSLPENAALISCFLDEGRISTGLDHDNVVAVQDVGSVDGMFYIALAYIDGVDIQRMFNRAFELRRPLALAHSIRIVADVAEGLDYIHRSIDFTGRPSGIIHRDVSPENIVVSFDGHAKLIDFSVAKPIDGDYGRQRRRPQRDARVHVP